MDRFKVREVQCSECQTVQQVTEKVNVVFVCFLSVTLVFVLHFCMKQLTHIKNKRMAVMKDMSSLNNSSLYCSIPDSVE